MGQYIVKFAVGASPNAILNAVNPALKVQRVTQLNHQMVSGPVADAEAWSQQLADHPLVEWVESNHRRRVQVTNPNDASFSSQYALANVEAVKAWGMVPARYLTSGTAGTDRVRVAVIDTGIDCTHPDFKNTGGSSVDAAAGGQIALAASIAFKLTTIPSPACLFQDDHSHGTHVGGIIAAATNNARGVAGLGYAAELMVIKALDSQGFGDDAEIADMIVAAVDGGADIVSMSLGGTGYSQALQDAMKYAWQRGVVVVSAAGNYNSSNLFYPGGSNYNMAVAAVDSANAKASFSNWGNSLGIAAPGVGILSTVTTYDLGDGVVNYANKSGTSMAAPYVSALASLVQMTSPGLGVTGTFQQIQRTANSVIAGGGWHQHIGYGVMNAHKAVAGTYRDAAYGSIRGQVTSAAGLPLSAATVTSGSVTVTTASDGLFRLANLTAGQQTVTVTKTGYSPATRITVVVAGADTPLPVTMGVSTGTYTGTVTSSGAAVSGAVVEVLSSGGLVTAVGLTTVTGQYTVQVAAGSYTLRASAFGKGTTTTSVAAMTAGATITANLTVTPGGAIAGTVKDASGAPMADVQVWASSGTFGRGAVTAASGLYSISMLPAGTYSVTASTSSLTTTVAGVVVTGGATTALDITMSGLVVTVSPPVVVLAGGQSQQFTAEGNGLPVNWTRSPATGTINTTGLYTAPSGTTPSTVTVKATSQANSAVSATATVLVNGKVTLRLGASTVYGGNNVTNCQITLSSPAPEGGLTVTLTSSNPGVVVPLPGVGIQTAGFGIADVSVTAGATQSATFAIATSAVLTDTSVSLTAAMLGMTSTASVLVKKTALNGIALGQSSVIGGNPAISNVVWLMGPAPAGGVTIAMASSDPAATVPPTVTVAEGQAGSNTFTIATSPVSVTKTVTISATLDGVTKTAVLTVMAQGLTSLNLGATLVRGGATVTSNSVGLGGNAGDSGVVVLLSSSLPAVAVVPASVTVPAGRASATFPITTTPVASNTNVTITATAGGVTLVKTLTVRPPYLSSLAVAASSVAGGSPAKSNKVNLEGAAPAGGMTVALTSSHPAVTVPDTVFVPEGQTSSAYFDLATSQVAAPVAVTITATLAGISKTDTLTVRLPWVSLLTVPPSSIVGSNTVTSNKVTLDGPAPAGGATVTLSSSNAAVASLPANIVVAGGQTVSPLFDMPTTAVTANVVVTFSAAYNGTTKTDTLTVKAPAVSTLSIGASSTVGGVVVSGSKATLDGPAPAGGATVSLTSSHPAVAPVPATVVVPPGSTQSPLFAIPTANVTAQVTVTFTATYGGVSKTDTLIVKPVTVSSLTVSPAWLKGGASATANRVTLDGPAPAGGAVVILTSSDPATAQTPASITVPEGQTLSGYFTITTVPVTVAKSVVITATYGGVSKTRTLSVNP